MIITRTPFRISFFGGSTDYPDWANKYGGAVLNTSINKYCYIMCRYLPPFFKYKYRIRYRYNEKVNKIDKIKHPTVRECLKFMNIDKGIEIVHASDLPAQGGLGSSSAFTVGLLHSLNALQNKLITKRQLALDAIHIEQNLVKEYIGSQDQTAASFGGFNKIIFDNKNKICVEPIIIDNKKLEILQSNLMLFFVGFPRIASDIASTYANTLSKNKSEEMSVLKDMVNTSIDILHNRDIHDFGCLLDVAWKYKKRISKNISNTTIDTIYKIALKNGALGGKICGAGGGGFMLFYVPKEKQILVKESLSKLLYVPFKFESLGSQIILYHVQDFY